MFTMLYLWIAAQLFPDHVQTGGAPFWLFLEVHVIWLVGFLNAIALLVLVAAIAPNVRYGGWALFMITATATTLAFVSASALTSFEVSTLTAVLLAIIPSIIRALLFGLLMGDGEVLERRTDERNYWWDGSRNVQVSRSFTRVSSRGSEASQCGVSTSPGGGTQGFYAEHSNGETHVATFETARQLSRSEIERFISNPLDFMKEISKDHSAGTHCGQITTRSDPSSKKPLQYDPNRFPRRQS